MSQVEDLFYNVVSNLLQLDVCVRWKTCSIMSNLLRLDVCVRWKTCSIML